MKIAERLQTVTRVFLDTAPVIYYTDLIVSGGGTEFALIDQETAKKAAELRARYNLSLTDAFQVAVAIASGCDTFLTNDIALKRVIELGVLVLAEMEL